MKKHLLLLALTMLAFIPAWSQDEEIELTEIETGGDDPEGIIIDGLEYLLNINGRQEARIRKDNCWNGELTIPSEVSYDGVAYTVTGLSWKAFNDCKTMTKVTIPKTVREVLSWSAFPEWYMSPFKGCTNLEYIDVDEDNQWFCSVDGVLYNKDMTRLYGYPVGSKRMSFSIPNGITRIYWGIFQDCKSLRKLDIPNTVVSIAEEAFRGCSALTSIVLPESVKYLDWEVFSGCESLKALVIKGVLSLNSDDKYDFDGMSEKTIIYTLPSQIKTIQKYFKGTVLPLDEYQPEEETTAIQSVKGESENKKYYDLQGRKINAQGTRHNVQLKKGIYIRDGRKVVVK